MYDETIFEVPLYAASFFSPTAVSFGAGLNSTALLCKWVVEGCNPPDRIIFADTGGERPETYEHVQRFSEWLVGQGLPKIELTRKGGRQETLEEYSLRKQLLPSLAYGHKGCSWKFKIEPQERDINRWSLAKQEWKRGDCRCHPAAEPVAIREVPQPGWTCVGARTPSSRKIKKPGELPPGKVALCSNS